MLLKALLCLSLGLTSGAMSGLLGIGGGSLITPALIYLLGFSQHIAQLEFRLTRSTQLR